jgi:dihydrolipoamide dehydrogenase
MYDLMVIGGGPGGYVAAIRAAQLGAKVMLVERAHVGGVCLNRGCIPTKAMIASSHALSVVKQSTSLGISGDAASVRVDMPRVKARKDEVVTKLRDGVLQLLRGAGIDLVRAEAKLAGPGRVEVGSDVCEAKHVLIATGSRWIDMPGLALDGERIVTTDDALDWESIPTKLLIVGGGVIGCEFACMMRNFGSEVTVVEAMPSILPPVEKAISRLLARSMKMQGINILTETTVERLDVADNAVNIVLSSGQELEVEKVLISIGRKPDTAGLGLESCGVALTERGAIQVNERLETNAKGIYAIGDVIGPPMLAHAASAAGIAAVENMFGGGGRYQPEFVPSPIFTSPEIGAVGATSEELKQRGVEFLSGRFPYAASGKALCDGDPDGQAIVHADVKGKLLGVHIIGANATLLIAEAALALRKGLSARDLEETVHAHPTLSEVVAEAAADVFGEAIHKAKARR